MYDNFLRKGDVVFDVGSNRGDTAYVFGVAVGAGGRVFAFEPSTSLCELAKTRLRSSRAQITIENMAINDGAEESVDFFFSDSEPEAGTIINGAETVNDQRLPNAKQFKVPATSLDCYARRANLQPNFIKIDVEGAELQVFKGMSHCLQFHPVIVFEQGIEAESSTPLRNFEGIRSILRTHGYEIFCADLEYERGVFEFGSVIQSKICVGEFDYNRILDRYGGCLTNLVAVPASKLHMLKVVELAFFDSFKKNVSRLRSWYRQNLPSEILGGVVQFKRFFASLFPSK